MRRVVVGERCGLRRRRDLGLLYLERMDEYAREVVLARRDQIVGAGIDDALVLEVVELLIFPVYIAVCFERIVVHRRDGVRRG